MGIIFNKQIHDHNNILLKYINTLKCNYLVEKNIYIHAIIQSIIFVFLIITKKVIKYNIREL